MRCSCGPLGGPGDPWVPARQQPGNVSDEEKYDGALFDGLMIQIGVVYV